MTTVFKHTPECLARTANSPTTEFSCTCSMSPPTTTDTDVHRGDTAARAAQLIAENLHRLPHPGGDDKARLLMFDTFNATGLPDDLANPVRATAQIIGEAIVHLLQGGGINLTEKTAAEPPEPPAAIALCEHGHPVNLTQQQITNLANR